jgi:hypothetical protein
MRLKLTETCLTILLLAACSTSTVKVKNEKKGYLKASMKLEEVEVKLFELDDQTASKPEYTQIYKDPDGIMYFTFLNNFNNSIYFYNYNTHLFVKKISWEKNGLKGISALTGYHIKSLDSIYFYNKSKVEIILSNDKGIILTKISLRGTGRDSKWGLRYPQYYPQSVRPFIETSHEILLTGFFFGSVPESILSEFKFTARIDFKTNRLRFSHTYPALLYGSDFNWEGDLFTEVYSDLHPDGDKLIISFPVSHDLYLADLKTSEYQKVYAGSNFAGTIYSLNKRPRHSSGEELLSNIVKQDEYTAIKYDRYHKVYYRFLLKAAPEASNRREWKEKPIAVIIMDENFNYLGETVIGTGEDWYWQNSFVTREGLNIEYIEKDPEEKYLTLKIFTIKKI